MRSSIRRISVLCTVRWSRQTLGSTTTLQARHRATLLLRTRPLPSKIFFTRDPSPLADGFAACTSACFFRSSPLRSALRCSVMLRDASTVRLRTATGVADVTVKRTEVLNYDPSLYRTTRVEATAADGTKVRRHIASILRCFPPILNGNARLSLSSLSPSVTRELTLFFTFIFHSLSPLTVSTQLHRRTAPQVPVCLVWRADRRDAAAGKPMPLLLDGYGSYGICSEPDFSYFRLPLLDRG